MLRASYPDGQNKMEVFHLLTLNILKEKQN